MLNLSSALSDVKVLDFSHLLAGPFATQTLGDYGAEVYKIERIHVGDDFRRWNFFNKKVGNYSSASYMAWNRNKRSIALDIRKPEAKKIIYNSLTVSVANLILSGSISGVIPCPKLNI